MYHKVKVWEKIKLENCVEEFGEDNKDIKYYMITNDFFILRLQLMYIIFTYCDNLRKKTVKFYI